VTDFHPECGSVARNTAAKIVYGAFSNNWLFSHKQVRAAGHQEFLFSQGITDYDPLRKDRRSRLGQLTPGTSPRNPPAAGMGVRLPDRLKARSRKEPKKRESEAGKVPHFEAALANLPLASCSGKNVLGEPLTSQRATLTSPCAH
jgi:hypothetical protein